MGPNDSAQTYGVDERARGVAWHAAAMSRHAQECVEKGFQRRDLDQIRAADRDVQFHFGMTQGLARVLNEGWHG